MDKEKLITKVIFGVEDLSDVSFPVSEEVRQNFEIAWDIRENFDKIKVYLQAKLFKDLKDKVEKELSLKEHGFIISYFDWGSIYITKPEWREKDKNYNIGTQISEKEFRAIRGIYAITVEKWDRNWFTIGIVRNDPFKTPIENEIIKILQSLNYRTTSWFIGYIPLESYFDFKDDKEFYLQKLLSDYDNLLEKTFNYLKKVYKDLVENKDLLNLFEESVKERKRQLNLDGVA